MKTVHEIDVEGARRAKHDLRPRRPPSRRVARKIMWTKVSFGFRNRERNAHALNVTNKHLAQQFARDNISRSFEEHRSKDGGRSLFYRHCDPWQTDLASEPGIGVHRRRT